ncbi:phage tail assembly chaperone G [Metabacillus fastidiosus]|uniref:phage tail assembly chaperone G n=1 Tax=Metabacillus fastidiosus TaxID=1458 RepID=UPI003D2C31A3
MNSLPLVLKMDGEDKRFVSPSFIKGVLFRQASDIATAIENNAEENFDLDTTLQFVCDVYGNQFDINQLENGIDARAMMKTLYAVVNFVVGNVAQASALLAETSGNEEKN